ncbi:alpha/beta hydrolase [Paenibacillus sp. JDR-2]|uniref:alpha/beta hydrolase n=1 Tax=Paenibacillus sp. (strain JDR-2) TaxID=324057 RepID=UPI000166B08D|nr:alpha/beta hydrolase [Paenibacillus sp. JDR-2]ACS99231.1 Alpha/beta hydrolase fold-3 domain protein [Paenibacillus sp. JDR-2]
MKMPEATKRFLEDIAGFPPLHLLSPEEIRKVVVANAISDRVELAGTEDITLEGPHGPLPVRIYRPSNRPALPAIVFFHGGGFVFNRMGHYDPMCGKLAAATDHAVISVDYRLAPEHKFPVPVEEAVYAAEWVYRQASSLGLDPERIAVAGESVGGNLAAIVAQQAVSRGTFSVAAQILLCPLTDWAGDYASKRIYGEGYFLDSALLEYCAGHYLNSDVDRANPLASPLYGDTAGVAPAIVVTAEYDPLRDEGELYSQRLIASGAEVTHKRYAGMIHLFYALTDVFEDGHDVYALINQVLGRLYKGTIAS